MPFSCWGAVGVESDDQAMGDTLSQLRERIDNASCHPGVRYEAVAADSRSPVDPSSWRSKEPDQLLSGHFLANQKDRDELDCKSGNKEVRARSRDICHSVPGSNMVFDTGMCHCGRICATSLIRRTPMP